MLCLCMLEQLALQDYASATHRNALSPCNLTLQLSCCFVQLPCWHGLPAGSFHSLPVLWSALVHSVAVLMVVHAGPTCRSASSGSGAPSAWSCSMAQSRRSGPRWRALPAAAARSLSQTTARSGGSRSEPMTHASGLLPVKKF